MKRHHLLFTLGLLLAVTGMAATTAGAQGEATDIVIGASEPLVVPDMLYPEDASGPQMVIGLSFHPQLDSLLSSPAAIGSFQYGLRAPGSTGDFAASWSPGEEGLADANFVWPRQNQFRSFHILRNGEALTAPAGIELWDDSGSPQSQRVGVFDSAGTRVGEFRVRVSFQTDPQPPTVESCGIDLRFGAKGLSAPQVLWSGGQTGMRLELWYDDQPFVTDGLNPTAGAFDLSPDDHHFKLNTFARLQLVNVVGTGDAERRIAIPCWRTNLPQPRWSGATCTVNLTDRTLRVLTASGTPVAVYPTPTSFTPMVSGVTGRSAAPPGVTRSDADKFPTFHTRLLTSETLAALTDRAGVRAEGRHIACDILAGTGGEIFVVADAIFDTETDLNTASQSTVDPDGTLHLLAAARRTFSDATVAVVSTTATEATVSLHGRETVVTFVRRQGAWKLSTRSLCQLTLSGARQSCPDRVRQPNASTCLASLATTVGRCQVHAQLFDDLYEVARNVFADDLPLAEASKFTVDPVGTLHLLPQARKSNTGNYPTPELSPQNVVAISETTATIQPGAVLLIKKGDQWKISYKTVCAWARRSAFWAPHLGPIDQSCRPLVLKPNRNSCLVALRTTLGRCAAQVTDVESQFVDAVGALTDQWFPWVDQQGDRQRHLDVLDPALRRNDSLLNRFRVSEVEQKSASTGTITVVSQLFRQPQKTHTIRIAKSFGFWRLSVRDICKARRTGLPESQYIDACNNYVD